MTLPENTVRCDRCQTEIAPSLMCCPTCGRLVHSKALKGLSQEADHADPARVKAIWSEMLTLLPPNSTQYNQIRDKLAAALPATIAERSTPTKTSSSFPTKAAGWGIAGLFLSLLAKGKLLLLGLTKLSTLLSMLASVGVYWTIYGWKFAVGLVASIYIHEMGHVAVLRRYGVKADAPLFIPGFGALVRVRQSFSNPHQDAESGLAGPLSGLVAAGIAYGVSLSMHWPSWAAIAKVGAWINLFNLVPFWQLDGSRGFSALTKRDRWMLLLAILALWVVSREGMLLLIFAVALYRTFKEPGASEEDGSIFFQYVFLLITLTTITKVIP